MSRRWLLLCVPAALAAQTYTEMELERMKMSRPAEPTPSEKWAVAIRENLFRNVASFTDKWNEYVDLLNKGIRDLKKKEEMEKSYERLKKTEGW